MDLEITSLADSALWETYSELDGLWPPFMQQDPTGGLYYRYLRENFAHHCLIAPVRPTGRTGAMREYAFRVRPDGLPVDPWLRVHVRAGGRIVNVAHTSMVMTGRLSQWREWTGLPFDADGPVEVPQALAPVQVSRAEDVAVYVEPNVWVHHRL